MNKAIEVLKHRLEWALRDKDWAGYKYETTSDLSLREVYREEHNEKVILEVELTSILEELGYEVLIGNGEVILREN